MVPPLSRIDSMRELIDKQSYFVVHAPRQSGKTTTMIELARVLTDEGRYAAVLLSMLTGSMFPDIGEAEDAILDSWGVTIRERLPAEYHPPAWPKSVPGAKILQALGAWAKTIKKPLVIFLDEIDALQNNVLLSVLRQIHASYPLRPQGFPSTIALIGMRDVRDYKVTGNEHNRLGSASPFNIKDRSLLLRHFNEAEVRDLCGQHTRETGQAFSPEVLHELHRLTGGHPWLVNALAQEMVERVVPDRGQTIDVAHLYQAKEMVIRRRDAHFDSLAERLREDRVRKLVEPIVAGGTPPMMSEDDRQYVIDLGLVQRLPGSGLGIANAIYADVIPRYLVRSMQDDMGTIKPVWLTADGKLDADKLLEAFLSFWQQHAAALMNTAPYHEAAPHLVMMAFLHRVENGGGKLHREFAIGSGRLDMLLHYGDVRVPMELKVWRPDDPDPLKDGLRQLDDYLEGLGMDTGWLVIFDRRDESKLKKIARQVSAKTRKTKAGRKVTVIRA